MPKHMAPTRRSFSGALARVVLLGLVCQGLMLFSLTFTLAQAGSPQVGDWFTFTSKQSLYDGTGWWEGYTEDTTSNGRYEITRADAYNYTVHAKYSWSMSGWDSINWVSSSDSGDEDRNRNVSITTRNYTQWDTDLDEFDGVNGKNLLAWFWVPINLQLGEKVQILQHNFTVTDEEVLVWSGGLPRYGLELTYTGPTTHYDFYEVDWKCPTCIDKYYVDRDSGFVFAERYEEQTESKYYESYWGSSFKYKIEFDVTASSYEIAIDAPALVGLIIGIIAAIALPALGIFAIYHYVRWRPKTDSFRSIGQVKITLIKKLEDFPQHLDNQASDQFGPFLVDFTDKTLRAGGRVAVAMAIGKNDLIGVAYYNKEEDVGNILCKNTEVTDALRRFIKCQDFFSEVRHVIPQDLLENMRKFESPNIQPQAYNIYETYQVLKLEPIPQADYDTNFVSYMQAKDLSAVVKVAKEVYGRGGNRTFRALLDSGDIGFVARVKGQIVGFAFASFVNQMGRNHTLTVLPKFRNQGIGRELARARLTTLANLGAKAVITEIADWNLSSLQVSNSLGFKKVGAMFVETARSKKIKKTIVRW
jgi:GNAT superfamily N-acetyltransferase